MHPEALNFTRYVKAAFPVYFTNISVLDVGAADINGNNRHLFSNCEYIGNDVLPHSNVTIVSETSKLPFAQDRFDVICSTECFEHDMHYDLSFKKIVEMLKPDGLLFFTCATTGRAEHGTLRTSVDCSKTTQLKEVPEWMNYYKNLTKEDVMEVIDVPAVFSYFAFYSNSRSHDLYFVGIKKGSKAPIVPSPYVVV